MKPPTTADHLYIARHELFAHGDDITAYTVDEDGNIINVDWRLQ